MANLKHQPSEYIDADEFANEIDHQDLTSQQKMDIEIVRWSVSLNGGYITTIFGDHSYTNVHNLLDAPNTKSIIEPIINKLPKYKRRLWGFWPIEDPISESRC